MHYLDGQIAKMGDEVSLTGATGKIVYSIETASTPTCIRKSIGQLCRTEC